MRLVIRVRLWSDVISQSKERGGGGMKKIDWVCCPQDEAKISMRSFINA